MEALRHSTPTVRRPDRTLAILVVAMALPTVLTWIEFVALAGPGASANPVQQTAIVLAKALQFSLPLLACWYLDGRLPRPGWPGFQGLGLGLAFGLAVALAMFALYFGWLRRLPELAATPAQVRVKLGQFGLDSLAGFLVFALVLSVVHSFLEEYYWRWFVFGRLARVIPSWPAIVLSSLAFMAHHVVVLGEYFRDHFWTAAVPLSLCVAVGGMFWAWLFRRTGTLGAAWISHLVIDAAIMVVGYDLAFVRQ